jgi:hypothetical protein
VNPIEVWITRTTMSFGDLEKFQITLWPTLHFSLEKLKIIKQVIKMYNVK